MGGTITRETPAERATRAACSGPLHEGDHGPLAKIGPGLGGVYPSGRGHALIHDPADPVSGARRVEIQTFPDG